MPLKEQNLYEFDEFVLDTSERQLWRGEEAVSMPLKAVETLCLLVENHGKLLSKDFLMNELWADTFVEERNLAQNVFTLRKILGENENGRKFIETVPKRGYRFVARVQLIEVREELIEVSLAEKTTIKAEGNVSSRELEEAVRTTAESIAVDANALEKRIGETLPGKPGFLSQTSPVAIVAIALLSVLTIGAVFWFWYSPGSEISESSNVTGFDPKISIAVMPFVNKSDNQEVEYLSDGMTETLINRLSRIPNLSVKARSLVFRYKGRDLEPKKIGSELGVEMLLLGTLVQRGSDLTLNLELVDTETENAIWGEKYELKLNNLVSLENEIAKTIAEKLKIKLSEEAEKQLVKRSTSNPDAYRDYLKGRFYWNKRTGKSVETGIRYFKQAIDLDPKYALAWSGLADSYIVLPFYTNAKSKDALPIAKSAVQKALTLDPGLVEARTSLASILHGFDWNFAAAEKEYKRAISLNPKYATARQWYSEFLSSIGKHEDAVKEAKLAQELEPLSLVITIDVAVAYHFARRFEESARQFERALEIFPEYAAGHHGLALALAHRSEYEKATSECKKAIDLGGSAHKLCLGYVYAKSGKKTEALKILSEYKGNGNEDEYTESMIYSLLGDKDKAFLRLEDLVNRRYVAVVNLRVDPALDNLRDDPRYMEMVKRIGIPE